VRDGLAGRCSTRYRVTYDTTFVLAGVAHRFLNTGDRQMRILWNYTSVEATRTFVDTGETVTHMTAGDKGGTRA
jgi:hypothetical protein